ncbi:MAG: hypothetical protein LBE36_02950 [Flavobacteriaceae bacterium]|jgi:hypothetical protein|nr:hypothetical protein [Flavobacteriaceae bacterium]
MSNFKELVFQMFDKMDDNFKKEHELSIRNYFEKYPCLVLMKDDLLGYLEYEYHRNYINENDKQKMKQHIENYDEGDMEYIAGKLVQDPMMDSFWYGIDDWLDRIYDKVTNNKLQN